MKKLGFVLASMFSVALMSGAASGQITYTWNVPSGAWTSSGSWTPARTSPAGNDVLVFDGSTQATATVTGIPRETIGQLNIINNAAVTFSSGTATTGTGTISRASTTVTGVGTLFTTELAVGDIIYGNTLLVPYDIIAITSNTSLTTSQSGTVASQPFSIAPKLTISGGVGDDFFIAAGSSLVVSAGAVPPILISVGSGAAGLIDGSMTVSGGAHRLTAADASGIEVGSGGTFTAGTAFSGNAFGLTNLNSVAFLGGSKYVCIAGSNPFGAAQPSSVVVFQGGSLFSLQGNVTPGFSGRTYANFELNSVGSVINVVGGFAVSIANLTITAGQLNFNMTGTPGHSIKGSISVAAGATLNFAPATTLTPTLNLNGTSEQSIGGAGTLTFNDADQTVVINNPNGIRLLRDVTISQGALTLTLGNITTQVANTLIIGSAVTVNRTSGHVIGNLRKAFAGAANKSFEVGTANGFSPVAVNVTAGTFPADFTISATQTAHPNVNAATSLQRYWTLTNTTITNADLTFQYLPGDPLGTEANYKVIRISGGTPVSFPSSTVNTGADTASITGVTGFSDWTAGEVVSPTASEGVISGTITDGQGVPVAGTVIHLSGTQNRKFITDANGYYQFDKVETAGFYTVTPSRANYGFNPGARSFSQLGNNTEATFTAVPLSQTRNPLDTPEYFVRQHYVDFLGREPDEAGFNFWSDQILECGADAGCIERRTINVSAAYFLSIEFQRTGGLVDRLYRASYGRDARYAEFMPDRGLIAHDVRVGRDGWEAQLAANEDTFVDNWVARSAFRTAFDSLSNAEYVDHLLANTGVSFAQTERDAFVGSLNGGTSRADVLQQIAGNENFAKARFNEAFVLMEYFGYLRRDPDEGGYQFWLGKLNQFDGNFERAEMVKAFINSIEYRERFAR